ncbi:flagellar protein FlaG [Pseudomonas veronii]|jgi:flagellar protein FlaG
MDMSVKLSLSYPAVAAQGNPAGKTQDVAPALSVEKDKEPQRPELENAVKNIQDFVQSTQRQLNFSIDDSTGLVVVKVIATDSGELIRQLPSEAALKLAQSLSDASSLLFDGKA